MVVYLILHYLAIPRSISCSISYRTSKTQSILYGFELHP